MSNPAHIGRSIAADPLGAAIAGGTCIGLVEIVALGVPGASVSLVVLALFVALGAAAGVVVMLQELAIARLRWTGIRADLVRGAGSLIVLIPVGGSLFEGGYAATLPGASTGHIWVPVVCYAALVGVLHVGRRWGVRGTLGAALGAFVVITEWANRSLYTSLYPDLHLLLVVASVVAAGLFIATVAGPAARPVARRPLYIARGAVAAIVALCLVLGVHYGLSASSERWVIATEGNHARHLVRVVRTAGDSDGDGFSRLLGGGDCDDGAADVNPGAPDVPGNGRDEDCDGADAEPIAAVSPEVVKKRAATLAQWRAEPETAALFARTAGMNVLVVSIDALRADLLADTAANRLAFPNLFRLLGDSARFGRAFAPSSGTDVSMSAFVTGRHDPFARIPTTVIEALAGVGYTTHGVTAREVLRWAPRTLLTRGLDSHDVVVNDEAQENIGSRITADETTERSLAYVDSRTTDAPFFLWSHYFDVHEHSQLDVSDELLAEVQGGEDMSVVERRYRALAQVTDQQIGRLIDGLVARGVYDRTIVVLFSDHGESLGEDPRLPDRHGLFVYNALTHIPLAIRIPGLPGLDSEYPVSLVDLMPTLCELTGAQLPDGADGLSLVPHVVTGAPVELLDANRVLVVHDSEQWGVVQWPYKLMVRPADNLIELYDLATDFAETTNLAVDMPQRVRELKQHYAAFPPVSFDRTRKGRQWRERQATRPEG